MALVTFRQQTNPFQTPQDLKTPLLLCLLVIGISGLITVTSYSRIQPEIPLFYSRSSPDQQLVAKQWIFLFPIASTIILITNRIFIRFFRKHDEVVTKLYTWMTLFLLCMLNFGLIRILFVIG